MGHSQLRLNQEGERIGVPFRLVGREQFEDDNTWHTDWHVARDDGRVSQLSETDGGYVWYEFLGQQVAQLPLDAWVLGQSIWLNRLEFKVGAIRTCSQGGAEGEVGHALLPGETFGLIELRSNTGKVLRIDYAVEQPAFWLGDRVSLNRLKLDADLPDGDNTANIERISCPSCGGRVDVYAKSASSATCVSCGTLIDLSDFSMLSGERASLAAGFAPLIPLGTTGDLQGKTWEVVGYEKRVGDSSLDAFVWSHYHLYNRDEGFAQLIELRGTWRLFRRSAGAPSLSVTRGKASFQGNEYYRVNQFGASTSNAIGEFARRVRLERNVVCMDYRHSPVEGTMRFLFGEMDGDEEYWLEGQTVKREEVGNAFPQLNEALSMSVVESASMLQPGQMIDAIGVIEGSEWTVVGYERFGPKEKPADKTAKSMTTQFQLRSDSGGEALLVQRGHDWQFLRAIHDHDVKVSREKGHLSHSGAKYEFSDEKEVTCHFVHGEMGYPHAVGERLRFKEAWQGRSEDAPAFLRVDQLPGDKKRWWSGMCLSTSEIVIAFGVKVAAPPPPPRSDTGYSDSSVSSMYGSKETLWSMVRDAPFLGLIGGPLMSLGGWSLIQWMLNFTHSGDWSAGGAILIPVWLVGVMSIPMGIGVFLMGIVALLSQGR
ncbi:DUF4178 domain-containing protein [Hydrogenophaga sp. 5NK40-0174]|uniref:DUF4178 domain-containing protein n=1 Tax=Hydrogenophaga sp. 5NK40-0174 TaxID=3127649 RepID=UPI003341418F